MVEVEAEPEDEGVWNRGDCDFVLCVIGTELDDPGELGYTPLCDPCPCAAGGRPGPFTWPLPGWVEDLLLLLAGVEVFIVPVSWSVPAPPLRVETNLTAPEEEEEDDDGVVEFEFGVKVEELDDSEKRMSCSA